MIDRSGQIAAGVHQSAVKIETNDVERKIQTQNSLIIRLCPVSLKCCSGNRNNLLA
jgi:hypothetical protein